MQKKVWENEYANPRLVTGGNEPQTSVKDFLRWLRRERDFPAGNIRALDLGCGNGKNTNYIAALDPANRVVGMDISETALAKARTELGRLIAEGKTGTDQVSYVHGNLGEVFTGYLSSDGVQSGQRSDASFDLVLDVTSSNSLTENERAVCLAETYRLLKTGGYFFVRALCKDGDRNAQTLLKLHPGKEKDTYIMPEMNLVERVFSRQDFIDTYSMRGPAGNAFDILHLEKETHYSKFSGRSYKRNFWVAYLRKNP